MRDTTQLIPTVPIDKRRGTYLPHWEAEGAIYSVGFRLTDSLPLKVFQSLESERESIQRKAELSLISPEVKHQLTLEYLEHLDRYLGIHHGSCWMKRNDIAEIVSQALLFFNHTRYTMLAWCVMPNHVHTIFSLALDHHLADVLHSWKSYTANKANKLLKRSGEFWFPEYYDHIIRDIEELHTKINYVLNNPPKAGLIDWKWVGCNYDDIPMR